ncbi:MAG: preprotein translocase subunit SecA, partial [Patescibacteria group bacterium]
LKKLFGDYSKKKIKELQPLVEHINQLAEKFDKELKDEDYKKKTEEFKKLIAEGKNVDELLPEAFALVKSACRRLLGTKWEVRGREIEWNMVPYDVQIIGAIILHQGKIAEMKTGEGKTLVCTMPVYLNALTGEGAHVVTVNNYLSNRDAEWMGGIYKFLGLTVGVIDHGQTPEDKRAAYECDITYGTNNEFGFDYLRDNMARDLTHCAQKEPNFAIVDEVDSILVDEARTPLIISAPAAASEQDYNRYAQLIPSLEENIHYNIDEKTKTTVLTEEGISKLEELLGIENIYAEAGFQAATYIEQALKAHTVYQKDIDYMVQDGQVIIIDSFTGRMMPGRRFGAGLHQAIEAKEGVEIKRESRTLATITFQNYFRMYKKLSGMTGTAMTEAEEFGAIYGLDSFEIPTHKPVTRIDKTDAIYKNLKGKHLAIVKKIHELHKKGQPVLVGTVSVDNSEILSKVLQKEKIPHNVLNAKYHEKEAEIVAKAGQKGTVTIATNMAGRGTDIKLGEGVKELGGLYIIGTERHESRRIDNQLRGRSGRQGDPGETQFYVSMEDDLMRMFGAESVKRMMELLRVPEDMAIENKRISKSIENAQKMVEGKHFDIRKHLVEYDNIMNKHRDLIYKRRRQILEAQDIKNDILLLMEQEVERIIQTQAQSAEVLAKKGPKFDYQEILETINAIHRDQTHSLTIETLKQTATEEELIDKLKKYLWSEYEEKEKEVPDYNEEEGSKLLRKVERDIYFRVMDSFWMQHIDEMTRLRENVALRSFGQRDPLTEYKSESFRLFGELRENIQKTTVNTIFKVKVRLQADQKLEDSVPKHVQTNEAVIQRFMQGNRPSVGTAISQAGSIQRATFDPEPGVKHEKTGRNDPCPCGSGKKYKKCCG